MGLPFFNSSITFKFHGNLLKQSQDSKYYYLINIKKIKNSKSHNSATKSPINLKIKSLPIIHV